MNTPPPDTLSRLLATLDSLRAERERQEAQERKANEDKKLAVLRPWWMEHARSAIDYHIEKLAEAKQANAQWEADVALNTPACLI